MESIDRLFVPLNTIAFNWYKQGKQWEVRKLKGQYNLKNVRVNRIVELRRGYNSIDKIWGIIVDVRIFQNSKELLDEIDYKLILPTCKNNIEAELTLKNFVSIDDKIISFKISLTKK